MEILQKGKESSSLEVLQEKQQGWFPSPHSPGGGQVTSLSLRPRLDTPCHAGYSLPMFLRAEYHGTSPPIRISLWHSLTDRPCRRQLEPQHTLAEQCIEGEGVVQVNVELSISRGRRMINIIDVLKPSEDYMEQQRLRRERQAARGLKRRLSPPPHVGRQPGPGDGLEPELTGAELDTVLEEVTSEMQQEPADGEETEDDVEMQADVQGEGQRQTRPVS